MLAEPISEPKWCHPPSPFIQPVLGMKRPIHKRERVIKEGPADGERKRENGCDGNGKLPCSTRKKETHFFFGGEWWRWRSLPRLVSSRRTSTKWNLTLMMLCSFLEKVDWSSAVANYWILSGLNRQLFGSLQSSPKNFVGIIERPSS